MARVLTRSPGQPGSLGDARSARPTEKEATNAAPAGGRIVVGVDDTPGGLAALRWALSQARSAGMQVLAVRSWALGLPRHGGRRCRAQAQHPHVVLYFDGSEQREACADVVRRSLRLVAGGIPRDVTITVQTPQGDPGITLTGIASVSSDLLVVGRECGHGIRRILHGSVSRYCSGHAHCPVVVVPAREDRVPGDRGGARSS